MTAFLLILNQMEFHLVQNRNCHHDHIPFNLKRNGNIVFPVQGHKLINWGHKLFWLIIFAVIRAGIDDCANVPFVRDVLPIIAYYSILYTYITVCINHCVHISLYICITVYIHTVYIRISLYTYITVYMYHYAHISLYRYVTVNIYQYIHISLYTYITL